MTKGLSMIAIALAVTAGAACFYLVQIYPHTPQGATGQIRPVEIQAGVGPKGLARALHLAGIISSPVQFSLWLRLTGRFSRVRAGSFEIPDNLSPAEIFKILATSGALRGTRVTVPEGYTLSRIGEILEREGLMSAAAFLKGATDGQLLAALSIPGPSAEGYLFPDTYFFSNRDSAASIITRMHQNFREHLASLHSPPGADQLHRTVILASIVQAEAAVLEEMPTIAGVYTNRLNKPEFPSRLLQADPTVSYGCEPFVRPVAPSCRSYSGVLTRLQLNDPANPYNTYRHPNLPPGPICAPGLQALRAALEPARVPYFYFVASVDGRHAFSTTLAEHNAAVNKFVRGGD